jgi:hypothetical protein
MAPDWCTVVTGLSDDRHRVATVSGGRLLLEEEVVLDDRVFTRQAVALTTAVHRPNYLESSDFWIGAREHHRRCTRQVFGDQHYSN